MQLKKLSLNYIWLSYATKGTTHLRKVGELLWKLVRNASARLIKVKVAM